MAINLTDDRTARDDIAAHKGHDIVAVTYGDGACLECETCGVVLLCSDDFASDDDTEAAS